LSHAFVVARKGAALAPCAPPVAPSPLRTAPAEEAADDVDADEEPSS
jgi:hypothetical protein